jgi:hypothetical protein
MVKQLPIRAVPVAVLLFAPGGFASASENADKAKAVVALVKAKGPNVAPQSRAATPKDAPRCSCGDACRCPAGVCPACPAAQPAPTVTYREVWYTDGRRTWRELVPETGGSMCPNGRCPTPR